jgi:hypothetical protein
MSPQKLPARAVRLFVLALVLLGLCGGPGCEDKPAPTTDGQAVSSANPNDRGQTKFKKIPRRPK